MSETPISRRNVLKMTGYGLARLFGIGPEIDLSRITKQRQEENEPLEFGWTLEAALHHPHEFLQQACWLAEQVQANGQGVSAELNQVLHDFRAAFETSGSEYSPQHRVGEALQNGFVQNKLADRLLEMAGKTPEEILANNRMLANPLLTPEWVVQPFTECIQLFDFLAKNIDGGLENFTASRVSNLTVMSSKILEISEWFSIFLEAPDYDSQKEILRAEAAQFDIGELIEALRLQLAVMPARELIEDRQTERSEELELWEHLLIELQRYLPMAFPTLGKIKAHEFQSRSFYSRAEQELNLNVDYTNIAAKILEKFRRSVKDITQARSKDLLQELLRAVSVTIHELAHHVDPITSIEVFATFHPLDVMNYWEEYWSYLGTIHSSFGGNPTTRQQPLSPSEVEGWALDPLGATQYGVDALSVFTDLEELGRLQAELRSIRQVVGFIQSAEGKQLDIAGRTNTEWFFSNAEELWVWKAFFNEELPTINEEMSDVEMNYLSRQGVLTNAGNTEDWGEVTLREVFQTETPFTSFAQLTEQHMDELERAFNFWSGEARRRYSEQLCDAILRILLKIKSMYTVVCWQTFLNYGAEHFLDIPTEVLTAYFRIETIVHDYQLHLMTGPAGHYFDSFASVTGELTNSSSGQAYQAITAESVRLREKYAEVLGYPFSEKVQKLQERLLQHQIKLQELRAVMWGLDPEIAISEAYTVFIEKLRHSLTTLDN